MSEQLHSSPEATAEKLELDEESERNLERLQEAAHEAAGQTHETVAGLQERAATEAISGKEITVGERESQNTAHLPGMHKELKNIAYDRSMERVRQNLSKPERLFSKLTHHTIVDKVSAVGARTIARPSGILGGSLCALLGSLSLLYFTKHYGFEYNYLSFGVLFVGGFALGLLGEGIIWLLRKR